MTDSWIVISVVAAVVLTALPLMLLASISRSAKAIDDKLAGFASLAAQIEMLNRQVRQLALDHAAPAPTDKDD